MVEAPIPLVAPRSLVFVAGAPVGFVVPYLDSQGSSFISLDWLGRGSAEFAAVRKMAKTAPAIRLLTNAPVGDVDFAEINARLAPFKLGYLESSCLAVHSPVQKSIRLCDVRRSAETR